MLIAPDNYSRRISYHSCRTYCFSERIVIKCMKIYFEQPEISVIPFDIADVITTSGGLDEDELPPIPIPQG